MKLDTEVCLGPGHIVLDGDRAHPSPKGHSPLQFSAHICCDQMAAWIKMSLGMELGLGPGDFVLHGDPAPQEKRAQAPPNFRPMSIMAEWLDEDATWYGSRPRPIVLDGDPAPTGKGAQ